jgi:DNA mismatch repair protein MutL
VDSRIALLPAEVIDQIAAGEVIERPASVVKELVDNAIDAGARTIAIEVGAGGRALVRVTDDGCGMSAADARLALERHATSKLRKVDDLWGLATLGFRGEALPSIASVSRMVLTTRREADLAATRIVVEAGRVTSTSEVGTAVGTTVEVADLLGNVPARLKFLKGEATEASHVTELVSRVAMAHPHLHLRLRHNGRTALDVPPDRDGFARVQALLGARIASRMVTAMGEEAGVRVTAYLAAPELAQTTARGVQIFVGKRPVRDRGLLHAIAMGYGELVPRGRYPVAVVHLDVPAGAVDINVHPQKLEVRFADGAGVCGAVRHVVAAGVSRASWRAEIGGAGPVQMTAIASVAPPRLPFDGPATELAARYAAQLRDAREAPQRSFALGTAPGTSPRDWASQVKSQVRASRERDRVAEPTLDLAPVPPPAPAPEPVGGFFAALTYLGQLDLTYLVCEGDGELVLVDQHAAHERVELARLLDRHTARDVAVQRMLFPVTIDATPAELALVGELGELLAQVGYEAEVFGKSTIAVKAVPAGIRHGDPAQLLRRLLDDWLVAGVPAEAERVERILATIACHSVVRSGDRLSPGEAEALLRSLDGTEIAPRHGHGSRPLLLRLPLAEIARRFGR